VAGAAAVAVPGATALTATLWSSVFSHPGRTPKAPAVPARRPPATSAAARGLSFDMTFLFLCGKRTGAHDPKIRTMH
jgi:hypothetical protein